MSQERFDGLAPLPPRAREDHKGRFGHLLVVAGSLGMVGAACLTARAALRGGAGLVTLACPREVLAMAAAQLLEVMTWPLASDSAGLVPGVVEMELGPLLARASALALGPGLGRGLGTQEVVRRLARSVTLPAVLDADALYAFRADGVMLGVPAGPRVITPHVGEFARLTGDDPWKVATDRPAAARRLALETGAVVLLKGGPGVVAQGQELRPCRGGNPGMATAGMGDVLTGLVGGLLAQGLGDGDAARLGMELHACAGDLAAQELGMDGLIASDVLERLPRAFKLLRAEQAKGTR